MIDSKRQGSKFKHNTIQLPRDNILIIYESDYWEAPIFTIKKNQTKKIGFINYEKKFKANRSPRQMQN